jgi:hypothetical protein
MEVQPCPSHRDRRSACFGIVADVVGYSRLAGADEERTLARLRGLSSDLIKLLASGIADLVLAPIIISGWPGTVDRTLGLLAGVSLLTSGWAIVIVALAHETWFSPSRTPSLGAELGREGSWR